MKNKNLIITILLLVITGGGMFFAGMKYQQSKRQAFPSRLNQGQGQRAVGTNRNGFQPINGEIIASDGKSITVKMADNSSKIVLITDNTIINKADTATKEELKTGEKVAVFGTQNSDGSVSAQNIQLNPIPRGSPTQ